MLAECEHITNESTEEYRQFPANIPLTVDTNLQGDLVTTAPGNESSSGTYYKPEDYVPIHNLVLACRLWILATGKLCSLGRVPPAHFSFQRGLCKASCYYWPRKWTAIGNLISQRLHTTRGLLYNTCILKFCLHAHFEYLASNKPRGKATADNHCSARMRK